MSNPENIVEFWVEDIGPSGWYESSDELDNEIRTRFLEDWEQARDGKLDNWRDTPEGALAFLLLTDQFARNMFRGDARSFETDEAARKCADHAIALDLDRRIDLPQRQFFYLPFMHSEKMSDQDKCIELMAERMADETGPGDTLHARVHRQIIQTFGRFPYRNEALGRVSTPEEKAFIDDGGYTKLRMQVEADEKTT